MIGQDQSSWSIIRMTHQHFVNLNDSASVSTIDKALLRRNTFVLGHLYLLICLVLSLVSRSTNMNISSSVVTLRIQLVLLPTPSCAHCEPSSGP